MSGNQFSAVSKSLAKEICVAFLGLILVYFIIGGFRNNYEIITVLLFWFSLNRFVIAMETILPLKELLVFICIIQWLVGPCLMYRLGNIHPFYKMFVQEDIYMSFAIPGTLFFALGLYLRFFRKKEFGSDNSVKGLLKNNPEIWNGNTGKMLVFIGFFFLVAPGLDFLGFIRLLLSQTLFIGTLILALINPKKYVLFLLIGGFGLIRLITMSQSFHFTFLWLVIYSVFFGWRYNWSVTRRWFVIILGGVLGMLIQNIKNDFRDGIGQETASLEARLFEKSYQNLTGISGMVEKQSLVEMLPRLNQGGIISRVMNHTPKNEPFAGGETLLSTMEAVFLPRFLFPFKKKSGGRENYERFTGFKLRPGTSMNISPLGEFYANFGDEGKYYIFFYGILISLFWGLFYYFSQKRSTLIFWLPLFFFQTLKAETDILTPMNHMVKSAFIIVFFYKVLIPNWKYFQGEFRERIFNQKE